MIDIIDQDYPTLKRHFPECFKALKASLIKSNDDLQSKVSQIISGFNDRLRRTSDDIEIRRLTKGKDELLHLLQASVQSDIQEYLAQ